MRKYICLALTVLVSTTMLTSVSAQYSLTIESAPAASVADHTVYRFYVNLTDPTDQFSAVFGNNESNLLLNTPDCTSS